MIQRNRIQPPGPGPGNLDYRYFTTQGAPFKGHLPLMNRGEYEQLTSRLHSAKSGLFDVRDPEQTHCGRTFHDVLEGARREEYEIFRYEEYNNGVGSDPNTPPALFVWLVWFEKYDILAKDLPERLQSRAGENGSGKS